MIQLAFSLQSLIKKIREEILWGNLQYALLSWLPILAIALLYKDPLFLKVGLIQMSLFIVALRLRSDLELIFLHYIMILLGFSLLYFSINKMSIFVILCALMAFATIFITVHGRNLRTLGNFTFIPAVYLACEIRHGLSSGSYLDTYIEFIGYSLVALFTILAFQYFLHIFKNKRSVNGKSGRNYFRTWHDLLYELDRGEPVETWLLPGVAIFFGVLTSALLVSFFQIDNAEWLIWSTASVITTDVFLAKAKLLHRFFGALIGASIGIGISIFLPNSEFIYSLSILGIMLTLISFKTYFIAVIFRCFFITLAASALHEATHTAFSRIENILIGGLIGLIFINLVHYFFKEKIHP
jgi:hypothetical protein